VTTEELHIRDLTPWCQQRMAEFCLRGDVSFTLHPPTAPGRHALWEAKYGKRSFSDKDLWQVIHLVAIELSGKVEGL
jgi:hypothetical protein